MYVMFNEVSIILIESFHPEYLIVLTFFRLNNYISETMQGKSFHCLFWFLRSFFNHIISYSFQRQLSLSLGCPISLQAESYAMTALSCPLESNCHLDENLKLSGAQRPATYSTKMLFKIILYKFNFQKLDREFENRYLDTVTCPTLSVLSWRLLVCVGVKGERVINFKKQQMKQ